MIRRYLVKLVRDRVGENLADTRVEYAPIEDREEAIKRLRGKLIEEAVEYVLDPSAGELADILEVVEGLSMHDPLVPGGIASVHREQLRKRAERGSFYDLIGMWAFTAGKWKDPTAHTIPLEPGVD